MKQNIFEQEYNKLNDAQKKAVGTIYGPVMVVAGPGTGKTQIIGLRTANILKLADVKPGNILITTFTDAWVIAIKKRLEYFLGSEWHKVVVSTIHSFCQDVIRQFPELFLQYKAGTPIDDVESLEILKSVMDEMCEEKKLQALVSDYDRYFYLRDIKSRISTLKQEAVGIEEFLQIIENQKNIYAEELSQIKPTLKKYEKTKSDQEKHILKLVELSNIYEAFNKKLQEKSYYDFNDMIQYVVKVMRENEDVKYFYAEKFQFIMLDEYQDTNNAQNKIIEMILSVWEKSQANILVVWDDDQSIYRFQGANIENMLDFAMQFENIQTVVLENNYRSTQPILDLCTTLIENNNERLSKRISSIEKKLISSHPDVKNISNIPTLTTPHTLEQEKAYLLQNIQQKIAEWFPLHEIAIIVRSNKEVDELSSFFMKNGVEVTSKLNTDILKNDFVKFLLTFLQCISKINPNESDCINIARHQLFGISQRDIFLFNRELYNQNYTKKFKITFFEKLLDIESSTLEFSNKEAFIDFKNLFLDLSEKVHSMHFMEFFSYMIDTIWIIPFIEKYGNFDDIQDVYTLFNKIKAFFELDKTMTLERVLHKFELYQLYNYPIPRQILKQQKQWIQILTSHSSKWLEYDVVFIPGLYAGNWDNKRVVDRLKLPLWIAGKWLQQEQDPIEEERRLFFVACSRAKRELHLSFPLSIENKIKLASTFLSEIKENYDETDFEMQDFQDTLDFWVKNVLLNKNILYTDDEFDYIEEFLSSYRLSPTDLNVFLEDPLQFLHSVVFKYPFIDNDATIFGKVYHRVLELFYARYKEKGVLDDVWYLTFTFQALLEREILTPESYEKLLEKWITWLKGFYETYKNNSREIVALEYNFRPKWLSFEWILMTWKIDKIEKISEFNPMYNSPLSQGRGVGGEGWQLAFFKETIALVDYKTWRPKSLWEIKGIDRDGNKKVWEGKYFRQLMFYKLLCELDSEFSSRFEVWALALDFVEGRDGEYKYIEVPYTPEEYEYFKNELKIAWEQISSREFWKNILQK